MLEPTVCRRSFNWSFSMVFVVSLAGCGDAPPTDNEALLETDNAALARDLDGNVVRPDVDVDTNAGSGSVCKHVTVKGQTLYNDQRTYGRFQLRQDAAKKAGVQYKLGTGFLYDDARPDNYLGLLDGRAEIYEVDANASGTGCEQTALAGIAPIGADGSWSWTGDVCDSCGFDNSSEGAAAVSIGVKIVLDHCSSDHERCFSVRDPGPFISTSVAFDDHGNGATPYALWTAAASLSNPHVVATNNAVVDTGQGRFQTSPHDPTDLYAQAANVFASVVDATRAVHTERGIAFKYDQYGDVQVIFPSNFDYAASHSHESNKICILGPGSTATIDGKDHVLGAYASTWLAGDTPMHEYGHIVNYRAWDGNGKWVDYNYGGATKEQDATEYYATAFKENFADFIKRVTMDDVTSKVTDDRQGCSSFDSDVSGALATCVGAPCATADRSPSVVEHTLCDLYDVGGDAASADGTDWGHDDVFDGDLQTVIDALKAAWNGDAGARAAYIAASSTAGVKDNGLRVCSLATAWVATHPTRTTALDETLLHNGLDCGLGLRSISAGSSPSAHYTP